MSDVFLKREVYETGQSVRERASCQEGKFSETHTLHYAYNALSPGPNVTSLRQGLSVAPTAGRETLTQTNPQPQVPLKPLGSFASSTPTDQSRASFILCPSGKYVKLTSTQPHGLPTTMNVMP
jgi:hypothetical protein